jgi:hypothetical protein
MRNLVRHHGAHGTLVKHAEQRQSDRHLQVPVQQAEKPLLLADRGVHVWIDRQRAPHAPRVVERGPHCPQRPGAALSSVASPSFGWRIGSSKPIASGMATVAIRGYGRTPRATR